MIHVAIVDDHPLIMKALLDSFALEEDIEVVGWFSDGTDLLAQITRLTPDVLLLDLKVPNLDPLALVERLRRTLPSTKIAVITAADNPVLLNQLLETGVTGIQLKSEGQDPAQLVRIVHGGSLYLSPEAASLTRAPTSQQIKLSERERTLLDLLAAGLTNEEIAAEMRLTNGTVGNYISQLYKKMVVSNRVNAVSWWAQNRAYYLPQ